MDLHSVITIMSFAQSFCLISGVKWYFLGDPKVICKLIGDNLGPVWKRGPTCISKKNEFFLLKINIFLVFLDRFDALISKIIFFKIKKIWSWCISKRKTLWTATATTIPYRPIVYIFFSLSNCIDTLKRKTKMKWKTKRGFV